MLKRITCHNGVVLYRSPLLHEAGIVHGFTTRLGGVSPPPFESLNFQPASRSVAHLGPGPSVQMRGAEMTAAWCAAPLVSANDVPLRSSAPPVDQYETVVENFRRVACALNCEGRRTVCIWQVHGSAVCRWPMDAKDATPDDPTTVVAQADALITDDEDVLLSVRVADCVPVLLADRSGKAVAAIHAGWRGVTANIMAATVQAMCTRLSTEPGDLLAAIGPCISTDHFEVGMEVAQAFDEAGLSAVVQRDSRPRPHVDLQSAVAMQLHAAGLTMHEIDRNDRCTFRDRDEFYSHRRDEGRTGRMAAVIGVPSDG